MTKMTKSLEKEQQIKRLANKQLVLEELRNVYERKYSASDILDGKLQNIFNFLSVVVGIAPTLELMINPDPKKIGLIFVSILLVVLILYYISFRKVLSSMQPSNYRQPITKNWDSLVRDYFDGEKEDVINRTISEYIISLDDIGEQNQQKILIIKQVSKLMAVIVALLLVAVPVNAFLPNPTLANSIEFVVQLILKLIS